MKGTLTKAFQSAFTVALITIAFSCQKNINDRSNGGGGNSGNNVTPKELKDFVQINLVGDNNEYDPVYIDANLVNAWGVLFPATGPAWVSAGGTGKSTIYTLDGNIAGSCVTIPCTGAHDGGVSQPTGHILNTSASDFMLPSGSPSQFIFASADGTISGWNSGNSAVKMVDNFPNAAYLGIAMASDGGNNFIYVANFTGNKIEVYNKNWIQVSKPFTDPNIPADFSPFNIQTIDGKLFVTYAKKNSEGKKVTGSGNGYINVYNPDGSLFKRFATRGKLDTPWGMAKAPSGFWGAGSQLTNMILVGNFGDGQINVFDANGNYIGPLYRHGKPLAIDGLWGITFPPETSYNKNYLYFAAGPDNGEHGLFGYIKTAFLN